MSTDLLESTVQAKCFFQPHILHYIHLTNTHMHTHVCLITVIQTLPVCCPCYVTILYPVSKLCMQLFTYHVPFMINGKQERWERQELTMANVGPGGYWKFDYHFTDCSQWAMKTFRELSWLSAWVRPCCSKRCAYMTCNGPCISYNEYTGWNREWSIVLMHYLQRIQNLPFSVWKKED